MGYNMRQVDSRFRIHAENKAAAFAALRKLASKDTSTALGYTDPQSVLESRSLEESLFVLGWGARGTATVRYRGEVPSIKDIEGIEFIHEYMGEESKVFAAIAPWVESGSFIELVGDDGHRWRLVFEEGKLRTETPRLVWGAESLLDAEFMECPTCTPKPGSPLLCRSCIHNRDIIEEFKIKLRGEEP